MTFFCTKPVIAGILKNSQYQNTFRTETFKGIVNIIEYICDLSLSLLLDVSSWSKILMMMFLNKFKQQ